MRAYVGPRRNDWVNYLDALALSYNTTPHTATGFAPAYLLRGYIPTTGSTLVHHPKSGSHNLGNVGNIDETSLHPAALEMSEAFHTARHRAQEALILGQHFQRRSYNKGQLSTEFQEGDLVLLNPHSLSLLRNETGRGRKLLMKYDGPFKIIQIGRAHV